MAAWRSRDNNSKSWPIETYDPNYVHPDTFEAIFANQCQNQTDWDNYVNGIGTADPPGRYQWSVNGVVQFTAGDCYAQPLELPGQGIHDVTLEVFAAGESTPYLTRTTDVRVRDYLIVLFGDSAASGEGSPDVTRGPNDEWGQWVDRRCHRSTKAAVPRAVEELEAADPHSTVTFLNFACSGATLKLWEEGQGVGILDPYAGIEPPPQAVDGNSDDESFYLLSQVDQLSNALHYTDIYNYDPIAARSVDMLFTTGGINDVRFAKLAVACVLLDDCHNKPTPLYDAASSWVSSVFDDLALRIPDAYVELADDLADEGIDVEETFVMQYPDAFESDDGTLCESMLWDVLPPESVWRLVLDPVVGPIVAANSALFPFLELELGVDFWSILVDALLGDLEWTPDEIDWMVDHGMPRLDKAVRDGAEYAGFTFVDGIQEAFANHGYCAADNWIRQASESSFLQGPWNFVSRPLNVPPLLDPTEDLGMGIHAMTKGLMHPSDAGYEAAAKVLKPILHQLKNRAPIAEGDQYTVNTAITPVQFDTGFGAGVLLNDFDPDDDPIRSILLQGPKYGTATLSQDGRLVYVPNPGFTGIDSVYYRATDGALTSSMVKVTLSVANPRNPKPTWKWNYPTGEETPVVQIGGIAEFPVCSQCGDLVLRLDPERQPGFGRVSFERSNDRWVGRYVQNGEVPPRLPYVDIIAVEIGRIVLGVFTAEGRAEIPVRIEGDPDPTWAWVFNTPESVLAGSTTRFDLCDACGELEVRVTIEPQLGSVVVELDAERGRWVATYRHDPASDTSVTGDGFGVEIGTRGETGGFTVLDATRVSLVISAGG